MAVADTQNSSELTQQPSVNSTVAVAVLISYGFAAPAILGLGSSSLQIGSAIAAVGIAASTALAVYRRNTARRWSDMWLTPPGLLWLMVIAIFCVASLQWVFSTLSTPHFELKFVAKALVAVSTMVWASLFGYVFLTQRLPAPNLLGRFDGLQERFRGAGLAAYLLGTAAAAVLLVMNRFSFIGDPNAALVETSSLTNALTLISSSMTYGAVLVLWNGLTQSKPTQILLGYGMFASIAVLGVVGGFKGPAIVAGLAVVVVLRLVYRRYPRVLLAGIALGVIVLFPLNTAYRSEVRDIGVTPSQALPVAISRATTESLNDPFGVLADTVERVVSRLRLVDSTAVIVARTPAAVQYESIAAIPIDVAAGLIPRTLWSDKPISDSGYTFGQEYFDLDPGSFTSIAITLPGSFYLYGGLVAVVVGGLALGMYVAFLDRVANPLIAPAGIILFLALVQPLTSLESALVPLILTQIQNGAIAVFALFLLVARRDSDRTAP